MECVINYVYVYHLGSYVRIRSSLRSIIYYTVSAGIHTLRFIGNTGLCDYENNCDCPSETTCLVHTSNFAKLIVHKILLECSNFQQ